MSDPNLVPTTAAITGGTTEERVRALDDYGRQFAQVMTAVAGAMTVDGGGRLFIADRVMRLAHEVHRALRPVLAAATDPELKFLTGLTLLQFGSREALPWLLETASRPGPLQYDVSRQLGLLGLPEVRPAILEQLRSLPLSDSDQLTGLLAAWKKSGEPLPADVLARLHSPDASLGLKVALKSL